MPAAHSVTRVIEPQRTVLIFQGGGALGAYQAGVFEALAEAGMAPDWVVGTSIGAINAALIAGNPPHRRLEALRGFWLRMSQFAARTPWLEPAELPGMAALGSALRSFQTAAFGLPGFFLPRTDGGFPLNLPTDPAAASFYNVAPLRDTLLDLVDFDYLASSPVRLSVGAVDVESAELTYFDSTQTRIGPQHILASGALPPAFPAVEIAGRYYWDGGIHSNTPLDWILHDEPRRHSLCLFASLWPQADEAPRSLKDVLRRTKEIQFASRAAAMIEKDREVHRLRHAVSLLSHALAEHELDSPHANLSCLGCGSVYHIVMLQVPRLAGEDQSKDIEFEPARVAARWAAGLADTRRALAAKPWQTPVPPAEGVMVHDFSA